MFVVQMKKCGMSEILDLTLKQTQLKSSINHLIIINIGELCFI